MTQEKLPHGLRDPFKDRGFKSIKQSVSASLTEVRTGMYGKRRVYPTKWERLNKNFLGGLQPGIMYVIAGRPGVGKSAFSNQLVFNLSQAVGYTRLFPYIPVLISVKDVDTDCFILLKPLFLKGSCNPCDSFSGVMFI